METWTFPCSDIRCRKVVGDGASEVAREKLVEQGAGSNSGAGAGGDIGTGAGGIIIDVEEDMDDSDTEGDQGE